MSVPLTPSADKNWITARWACLVESMARPLTVISLLLQSTTHCRYRVYTKFLLTYTAIYRRNRKVLPLGITALRPQSHFHLGTLYIKNMSSFCVQILCNIRRRFHEMRKNELRFNSFLNLDIQQWILCVIPGVSVKYRVIKNDCRGFNNLSYTIHLR